MNMVEQVTDYVKNYDEEVGKAIELELGRQRRNLELIASENIISPAEMMAMATVQPNNSFNLSIARFSIISTFSQPP